MPLMGKSTIQWLASTNGNVVRLYPRNPPKGEIVLLGDPLLGPNLGFR
jgi:hypothetical protein